jgi:hypothetical protein
MTERSLVYKISVRGQAEGITAIRSIADAAAKASREESRSALMAARDTADARRRSTDASKKSLDEEAKHATMIGRLNQKLEGQRVKDAEKGAKEREKAAIKAGDNIVKALGKEVREHEKAETAKTRATEKEARERQRFVERAEAATSQHMMAERRKAIEQMSRDARQFARDRAFEERRLYKGLATSAWSGVGGAMNYSAGLVSRGARAVASGEGLNRATDIASIVGERAIVNRTIRRIAIENRGIGQVLGGEGQLNEIEARREVANASKATGTSQTELVEALNVFSEKGKGREGLRSISRVGSEALAMGVDPAVVAKLRAQMMISSEASGKSMSEKDLQAAVGKIALVGKSGVFRAGAIAQESEALFSRAAAGGLDFRDELTRYVGFANMTRSAAGGGANARTYINSVQDSIAKNEGKLRQHGVEIRNEAGGERGFVDIIEDIISKGGGNVEKMKQMGIGDMRAMKAFTPMLTAYTSTQGSEAEKRAAMEAIVTKSSKDVSSLTDDQVVKEMNTDITAMLDEEGTKMSKSVESIRQTLAEQLEPLLVKLSKTMPDVIDGFGTLVGFIKNNPVLAAGTVASGAALANALPGGVAAGARYLAGKLVNTVPGFGGAFGGAVSNAISGAGATQVYVTNMPAGGLGGMPAGVGGKMGGEFAAAAGPILGGLIAGVILSQVTLAIGDAIGLNNKSLFHKDKEETEDDFRPTGADGHRMNKKPKLKAMDDPNTSKMVKEFIVGSRGSVGRGYGPSDLDMFRNFGGIVPSDMDTSGKKGKPIRSNGKTDSGLDGTVRDVVAHGASAVIGTFHKEVAEATKAIESLKNAARDAKGTFSVLKGPF